MSTDVKRGQCVCAPTQQMLERLHIRHFSFDVTMNTIQSGSTEQIWQQTVSMLYILYNNIRIKLSNINKIVVIILMKASTKQNTKHILVTFTDPETIKLIIINLFKSMCHILRIIHWTKQVSKIFSYVCAAAPIGLFNQQLIIHPNVDTNLIIAEGLGFCPPHLLNTGWGTY